MGIHLSVNVEVTKVAVVITVVAALEKSLVLKKCLHPGIIFSFMLVHYLRKRSMYLFLLFFVLFSVILLLRQMTLYINILSI